MVGGKSPGHDGLSIEHLKHAGVHLPREYSGICLLPDILWEKVREAGVPSELTSLFQYWYSNQCNQVRWGSTLSEPYRLECGVRQGGLTSPKLFNLNMNELIVELSSKHVGCKIDGTSINNISYADDMVLLGPTAGSIREMLQTCERYAATHGLQYNTGKSEYLIFEAPGRCVAYEPVISLNGRPLNRVKQFKYLGHYLTVDLKDQVDTERERRALAVRCNMLAHRFARCSRGVKITLFKAFCTSFYTGGLWVNCTRKALDALRVQYNNVFRLLLGLPRYCSASGMFAEARVDDFYALMRKKAASLLSRSRSSANSILQVLADKHDAPVLRHWIELLVRQTLRS
ncbi:uncharacterized protein LOC124644750 [Helicoverpa zea]|uniref:uncharacterized protein LOC124644750 n=1 Tax=Helicoverpa zea TaxID=7113 RepID=UPI001F5A0642|nr:uncharacterized protein LOC124644750 [Helicoverpa zea]